MTSLDPFDYALPPELIAQEPVARRDHSRLLVLRRNERSLSHHRFDDLPDLLTPGDLLVLNDTRVVPARLVGHKPHTGGKWEGLFVREHPGGLWEMLLQTRGRLAPGQRLLAESAAGLLGLELIDKVPPGRWRVRPEVAGPAPVVLQRHGQIPIPPYIRQGRADAVDSERYQTLHARREGSVAAPTAGLHFTHELYQRLEQRGIARAFVTLHVGPGTFQPVKVDDIRQHRVEQEWAELPEQTAAALAACRQRLGRIVAVGTTTVRVLESVARAMDGPIAAWSGWTDLTIVPPFEFRVVDALISNFHLPRSSLLLLVSAFAGTDFVMEAYREAVQQRYRFYSYGDATLIL